MWGFKLVVVSVAFLVSGLLLSNPFLDLFILSFPNFFTSLGSKAFVSPGHEELLTDGDLHVFLCGTGTPLPDPNRAGACTVVIGGGFMFVVDTGPSSQKVVQNLKLPRENLSGILITHFHSDHIGELGEFIMQSWIAGRTGPLKVYGPKGIQDVVDGFQMAYQYDTKYRVEHHAPKLEESGAKAEAQEFELHAGYSVVFNKNGFRILAFEVDHGVVKPAVGYRFDYGGRSVVVSGDTKKFVNLLTHSVNTDLLIHEVLHQQFINGISNHLSEIAKDETKEPTIRDRAERFAKFTHDIVDYHTTPREVIEIAHAARTKMVVFTHLVPSAPRLLAQRLIMSEIKNLPFHNVVVGEDGMYFRLPKNSQQILKL